MRRDRRSRVFGLALLVLLLLQAYPAVALVQAPPEQSAADVFSRLASIAARFLGISSHRPAKKPQEPTDRKDDLRCTVDPNGVTVCVR